MDSQMVHVRVPAALLARLDAEAARRGVNRTALIVALCEAGLDGGAPVAVSPAPVKPAPPAAAPKPAPAPVRQAARSDPGRLDTARLALANAEDRTAHLARTSAGVKGMGYEVQIGPVAPLPGSRLKGAGRRPGERAR